MFDPALHKTVKALEILPMLDLPKIPGKGKEQTLQEWHAAGGSVPVQYKSRPHVWHAKVKKYADGGSVGGEAYGNAPDDNDGGVVQDAQNFAEGGAAFGKYPAMKPSTSKGKKEAQYRLPLDVARGAVAGVLGMPGDIETLGRLGVNLAFGPGGVDVSNESFLPTSEDIEKRIPFRGTEPVNELGAGFGSLVGGLSPAPAKAAIQGAKAVGRGALTVAKKAIENANVPVDPLFRGAAGRQRGVVKLPGGNWLGGSVEEELNSLKARTVAGETPAQRILKHEELLKDPSLNQDQLDRVRYQLGETKKEAALDNWIDRNLTNYVKKQMGTVDDPVRKLAEEGIVHIPTDEVGMNRYKAPEYRKNAGTEQLGQSEAARAWEDASDVTIRHRSAQDLIDPAYQNQGNVSANIYQAEKLKTQYPWLEKLAPESRVYSMQQNYYPANLGFDHIIDVLKQDVAAGRLRPDQLNKVSMEQAVRRTYEYDQEMAKKMREAQAKVTEGMPVHKEYPEGYKWIELAQPKGEGALSDISKKLLESNRANGIDNPESLRKAIQQGGYEKLEQALKYEGDTMGHCVGGYCPDVSEGRSRIYSLRDAKGEPHVTVEVQPSKTLTPEKREAQIGHLVNRMLGEGMSEEQALAQANKLYPESETAQRIVQIKGKQNRAPNEQYIPYVQDFVKSGNWSDVGDAKNAGLRRYGDVFNVNEQRAIEASGQPVPNHEYLSGEDIQRLHNAIVPEGKRLKYSPTGNIIGSDEGFKSGGEVHMAGGGLLTAALAKLGKAGARLSAEELQAVKQAGRIAHANEASARAAKDAEVAQQMASLPARSKSANEALGLYHPVGGGVKLSKPVTGMHATTVADPKFNQPLIKTITPEQLVKEEAALFPLVGDRAAGGRYLTHVGENELEEPVRLTAGARYMDANYNPINPEESAAWESGLGRVTALGRQAERAGEGGRPVYGVYTAGSGTNTDFNVMGANALLQQLPHSKITKKAAAEFDNAMREGTKVHGPLPDWPGILSPETYDLLLDKSNGGIRTKLFDIMGKEKFQSMGFPDVPATRKAIVEPELLDVPTNQAGFRLARMDTTGRIIENPIIPSDYPSAMAGKVAGTLDRPEDYKDIWQSHFGQRRLLSQPESGDYYSFSRAHPIQYADQEWLDKIMQGREKADELSKIGKYAQGGSAKKKPSGGLASIKNKQSSRSHTAKET